MPKSRNSIWLVAAFTLVATSASRRSVAVVIPDGASDAEYIARADQFQGSSLWLQARDNNTGAIGYASAVRLNDYYALTAAHNVHVNGASRTLTEIGNGRNFFNDPGETRNVASVLVNPGFQDAFHGWYYDTIDIAIIKFDRPLPGPSLSIGTMDLADTWATYSG